MENNLASEILYFGIGNDESILHFGACDSDVDMIRVLNDLELDVQYTAVDVNEEKTNNLFHNQEIPKRNHQWISTQDSMQDFISNIDDERYHWTIITGLFDKIIYKDAHYPFIFTTLDECMKFSDNVIFSLKKYVNTDTVHNPSFIFEILVSKYGKVNLKKLENHTYLYCVTH